MAEARSIRVRGIVQGVGFRPFVYRLAQSNILAGWVLNGDQGVEIFLEGAAQGLDNFVRDLKLKSRLHYHSVSRNSPFAKAGGANRRQSGFRRICRFAMHVWQSYSIQPIAAICILISIARTADRVTP
jgi:acylphosphatase